MQRVRHKHVWFTLETTLRFGEPVALALAWRVPGASSGETHSAFNAARKKRSCVAFGAPRCAFCVSHAPAFFTNTTRRNWSCAFGAPGPWPYVPGVFPRRAVARRRARLLRNRRCLRRRWSWPKASLSVLSRSGRGGGRGRTVRPGGRAALSRPGCRLSAERARTMSSDAKPRETLQSARTMSSGANCENCCVEAGARHASK